MLSDLIANAVVDRLHEEFKIKEKNPRYSDVITINLPGDVLITLSEAERTKFMIRIQTIVDQEYKGMMIEKGVKE